MARPSHQSRETKDDLTHVAGLGNVIVGPELEPGNPVGVGASRTQKHDAGVACQLSPLEGETDVGSRNVWKNRFEQDDVGLSVPCGDQTAGSRQGSAHRKSSLAQRRRQDSSQGLVGIDDQDFSHRNPRCYSPGVAIV
jgi:hypothetical protein